MDHNTPGPSGSKRPKLSPATHEDQPTEDSKERGSSSVLDPEFSENRRTVFDLLDELGKPKLEEEFKRHFKYLTKLDWKDSPACGQAFVTAIGVKRFEETFTYEAQRNLITNGDIKCWDITLLGSAIRVTNNNRKPKKNRQRILDSVKTLINVRNPASHTPGQVFHNQRFEQLFEETKAALKLFNYTDEDIHKVLKRPKWGRPVFTCEAPRKEFCGREGVLDASKEAIKGCNAENMIEDKIVVINGFGGMGKSQIGKCLAQRLRSDKPHYPDLSLDVVYWFDAQTESAIKNGFESLAQHLEIKHKLSGSRELDLKDISKVYTHLSKWYNRKVLLIFDNAEQMEETNGVFGLKKYLDPDPDNRCEKPVFLVTSRVPWYNWVKHSSCIQIDELTADDTRTCLLHYMGILGNNQMEDSLKEAIDSLLEITGGHPLGLALMGTAMAKRAQEVTLDRSSWVQIVNAYLDLLGAKPRPELSEEDKYRERVKKICEYTLAQIDDGSSESIPATLLGVVACLHPDYIDLGVVQGIWYVDDVKYECPGQYLSWEDLHVDIRKAINLLLDYSLVDLYTVGDGEDSYDVLKIHRVVQKCMRDISLKLAPARSPLQEIRKFLRSKAQHKYNDLKDHVMFLLRLHEDTPKEPNPLDPSSIIELTSWDRTHAYERDDKGNRLFPRISVEAIGTRVLNEDEHHAIELILQRWMYERDWKLIENLARALYGSTCLAPEWLIEVCCEMISDYVLKDLYRLSRESPTNSIAVRVSRLILQCYRKLPETLTIRTPKNVLVVLGGVTCTGEKIEHEIISRVFLEAGLDGFWKEYCNVYYNVAGFFKDEWLSGLFPPSASSFFTQSFQSLEPKLLFLDTECCNVDLSYLLQEASKKPYLIAQLLKEIDGSDCAFWKYTEKVLEMHSVDDMHWIIFLTFMWLQFFREDENVYNSYGDRLDTKVEIWFPRYLETDDPLRIWYFPRMVDTFYECATQLRPYYTERTKTWIKNIKNYLYPDDEL